MLLVPWAVGCGVAGRLGLNEALLLAAMIAFFLAQSQLMAWWRLSRSADHAAQAVRRAGGLTIALGLTGLIASVPLLLGPRRPGLLWLGAAGTILALAALFLVGRRRERALPGQMLAAVGLALSAPAAWYVATGALDRVAVALWGLAAAYFVGAVCHVRLLIEARAKKKVLAAGRGRLAFSAATLGTELGLVVLGAGSLRLGGLSLAALAGFVPLLLVLAVDVTRLHEPAPLKRVGLLAAGCSILFALLVIRLA
jgi:YwiC-like protein